ncbi:MAG TPA: NADP-dependent oxidoreductase [Candidatus Dormibacteraeota bacterium]|nr:NADP-dependent oxidoreductase [Candidatus Dormibacteraeota bacterium]
MKASRLHVHGSVDSLRYEDAPDPHPASGEVMIRVHAAGVTPSELRWAPTAVTPSGSPRPLPLILGHEFSGEVAALGADASGFRVGDPVYGLNDWFGDGACAEYCRARVSDIARKPAALDHVQASVVPISALTAWQGLFARARLAAGQRVLIHGGAGAVGVFAVQLAHWRGAHVIATVSRHNADFVRGLGADEAIDYRAVRFEDAVGEVDVVFDAVGGETLARSWAVLTRGGTLVTIAASSESQRDQRTRDAFFIVEAKPAQLDDLTGLMNAGQLGPVVDGVFPLSRARDAYEYRPRRGKAAIAVVEES